MLIGQRSHLVHPSHLAFNPFKIINNHAKSTRLRHSDQLLRRTSQSPHGKERLLKSVDKKISERFEFKRKTEHKAIIISCKRDR